MDPEEPGRDFDREYDERADAMFAWRRMTPEEWVARWGHTVGCCSLHRYRYRNPELGNWMRRLGELLTGDVDEEEIDRYRRQYLTRDEYARVRREITEPSEHGL